MVGAFQNQALTLISVGKRDNNRKTANPDLKHTLNHTLYEQRRADWSSQTHPVIKETSAFFFNFLFGPTQTSTSAIQPSLSSRPREDERTWSGFG